MSLLLEDEALFSSLASFELFGGAIIVEEEYSVCV